MARPKKTTEKEPELTKERLITLYMNYVLEKGEAPSVVYTFARDHKFGEEDFYQFFGSFEALRQEVWQVFFSHTLEVMEKSETYSTLSTRERLLTFYYTFFEMLTANRSYVLFALKQEKSTLKSLEQLKTLRREVKEFARGLIRAKQENSPKSIMNSGSVFAEATWIQLLFLLKFWMDDSSPQFEKTDMAIEKSVNTVFDVFNPAPIKRVLDLGKFIWKEKMA